MAPSHPFVCTIPGCDKSYESAKGLSGHTFRHEDRVPTVRCPRSRCGKLYQNIKTLNVHLKFKHPDESEDSESEQINSEQEVDEEREDEEEQTGDEMSEMIRCEIEGCTEAVDGNGIGFKDKKALLMHLGTAHAMWRCTLKACEFEAGTSKELRKHRMSDHSSSSPSTSLTRGGVFANETGSDTTSRARKALIDGSTKQVIPQRENTNQESRDTETEMDNKVYVCATPGCGFVDADKDAIRQHKEVHPSTIIDHSMNALHHQPRSYPLVENATQSQGERYRYPEFDRADFSQSTGASHINDALNNTATVAKGPLLLQEEDTILSVVAENDRSAALRLPFSVSGVYRARNIISTPARGNALNPKTMRALDFARMGLFNQPEDDPQPIRRSFPIKKKLNGARYSNDDDEESETENGDSESSFDDGLSSEEDEKSEQERPRKRNRTAEAVDHDRLDTGISPGVSDTHTTAVSRRRVIPPLSKSALQMATYSNPYASMPSLQRPSGAGLRNDILFAGVPASAERQAEIDSSQPRGLITEDTDFDSILAFPGPKLKQSAMAEKLRLQTYEFVKAREEKPNHVRMEFFNTADPYEAANPVTDDDQGLTFGSGAGIAAASRGGVQITRISKNGKIKKLGSRTKLVARPKRPYVWKNLEKNRKKETADAARLAAILAAGNVIGGADGDNNANSAPQSPRSADPFRIQH